MNFVLFAAMLLAAPRCEPCPTEKCCTDGCPTASQQQACVCKADKAAACGKTSATSCGKVTTACGKACAPCGQTVAACGAAKHISVASSECGKACSASCASVANCCKTAANACQTVGTCCQTAAAGCQSAAACCAEARPHHEAVVLSFSAKWCGPCQKMAPVVARLKRAGLPLVPVDVDQHRELAEQFGITSIPAYVAVVHGREIDRVTGVTSPAQLCQLCSAVQPPPRHVFAVRAPMAHPLPQPHFGAPGATSAELLVRATYEICPDKAAALAAFLKTVDASAEVKHDGSTLTVTATPEVQQAIGRFVAVVISRPATAHVSACNESGDCGPKGACQSNAAGPCTAAPARVVAGPAPHLGMPFLTISPWSGTAAEPCPTEQPTKRLIFGIGLSSESGVCGQVKFHERSNIFQAGASSDTDCRTECGDVFMLKADHCVIEQLRKYVGSLTQPAASDDPQSGDTD